MFDDRDAGINHARARHSRDYTACRQVLGNGAGPTVAPRRPRWLPSLRGAGLLAHLTVALVASPLLAVVRGGSLSS